jgi:Holliday junction resolvase RusA-like endonuclease
MLLNLLLYEGEMKSKKEKIIEYNEKYGHIPKDYTKRLEYLYDTLKINDTSSDYILQARDAYMHSTYFETIRLIMYEVPEFTPRPRARLITRNGILNSVGTNSFIQVYSITGRSNKEYMAMYKKENLSYLDNLLCTPCDIEYRAYFPTPSYYNKTQIFLAEIGLDRPLIKPDFDNIEKSYGDAFTGNIWIDDIVVVDATIRKYYSILPRMEIDLKYSNQLCNQHQYKAMIRRKDYTEEMDIKYFGG